MRMRFSKAVAVLAVFAVIMSLAALPSWGLQSTISKSVPQGETDTTVDLVIDVPSGAQFAAFEFSLRISDESALEFTSFTPNAAAFPGAMTGPFAQRDGNHFFGILSQANSYQTGTQTIGTLHFKYTGNAPATATINHMTIARIRQPVGDGAEGEEYNEDLVVINFSRVGGPTVTQPPVSPDGGGPNVTGPTPTPGPSSSPNPTASASPAADATSSSPAPGRAVGPTLINDGETPLGVSFSTEHIKYINGYPDGSVHPDANITRAEAVAIFYRLIDDAAKETPIASTFNDVPAAEWYAQSVSYAAAKGIVLGYSDGGFHPEDNITRAEFATIMSRFVDGSADDASAFPDVPASHWANEYVAVCVANGWITGYPDGTFQPDANITRAEAVTVLNRALGRGIPSDEIPAGVPSYTDLPSSHWAYAGIIEASVEHEFTIGADGTETWVE